MKVIVFAHAHPDIRAGGGEIAAYRGFQQLKAEGVDTTFVALVNRNELGQDGVFSAAFNRPDEIFWRRSDLDSFYLAAENPDQLRRELKFLLDRFTPDVAHFHHYFGYGVDALDLTARTFGLPTALTLHEFGAICPLNGRMVKADGRLCHRASPLECSGSLQARTPGEVFLRRERLLKRLGGVKAFLAPSQFLAGRYVEWGLDARRIHVIENPAPSILPIGASHLDHRQRRFTNSVPLRISFFGQLIPVKGVDLLLEAFSLLSQVHKERIRLHIHGTLSTGAHAAYSEALLGRVQLSQNVSFYGPYAHQDVVKLMRNYDWIVVPSLWWENSPLVIQEAAAAGVPVLTANIGGMEEKVKQGQTGTHFEARSASSLASRIVDILEGVIFATPPHTKVVESGYKGLLTQVASESR